MLSNFKLNLKSLEMVIHFQLSKGMSEGQFHFSNTAEKIHLPFEIVTKKNPLNMYNLVDLWAENWKMENWSFRSSIQSKFNRMMTPTN